jgi:tRNA A-37 threonylcarbamoyl transferase component Bud32
MVVPRGAPLCRQGWKLHISSCPADLAELVQLIVPVLAAEGCAYKVARSPEVLATLNDGSTSPASVGKALTIYPDQRRVSELGRALAELLQGREGPRVLSDRQVSPSAPVYYRYGLFAAGWEADPRGRLSLVLRGPDGETCEGSAALAYRQPPWATDPFTGEAGAAEPAPGADLVGGHYRITEGLRESAQGNVYRAIDLSDGSAVVIKQARALVAQDGRQADTRLRLRNERRVLQALSGIAGVPRFTDHFRHGQDEFLVTADCGQDTLVTDVLRHGAYRPGGSRSLGTLAGDLARILAAVHDRGVIMRDLSPKNIIAGRTGVSIVDFGLAAYDGLHLSGATPGYAPARQWRDAPPEPGDDYFALGMTLLYAATMLNPVSHGADGELARTRALQAIRAAYGENPGPMMTVIADLLSDDAGIAAEAFGLLARGQSCGAGRPARPLPEIPVLTPALAAEVTDVILADLLRYAAELPELPASQRAAHDVSIYQGSAGIGLELLQHPGQPDTASVLADLAEFTVRAAARIRLPPALLTGITGADIFLHQAAASGISTPARKAHLPEPGWQPVSGDLMSGAAGVGLGHLWLHQATGDPAHLDVAIRCGHDLLAGTAPAGVPPGGPELVGIDTAAGRAHGLAGSTEFLLALVRQTGDEQLRAAAAAHAGLLAERTRNLMPAAGRPDAAFLVASWCEGLAGIGQVLLQAGQDLADESLLTLAQDAADICIRQTPRLSTLGRCCGAAGVGCFLIDLAVSSQQERYWQAARDVGLHLLLRSAGPPGHPVFVADNGSRSAAGWESGLAGILAFFRRLARSGGPDSIPL